MKCNLCGYYEASNEADLKAHQHFGHTESQVVMGNGTDSSELLTKLKGLGYYNPTTPPVAPIAMVWDTSGTSVPAVVPAKSNLETTRNFRPEGFVLANGVKVYQVIASAPGYEVWEIDDGPGGLLYESHPSGEFERVIGEAARLVLNKTFTRFPPSDTDELYYGR